MEFKNALRQKTSDLQTSQVKCQTQDLDLAGLLENWNQVKSQVEDFKAEAERKESEIRGWMTKCSDLKKGLDQVTSRYQDYLNETSNLSVRERDIIETLKATESEV